MGITYAVTITIALIPSLFCRGDGGAGADPLALAAVLRLQVHDVAPGHSS